MANLISCLKFLFIVCKKLKDQLDILLPMSSLLAFVHTLLVSVTDIGVEPPQLSPLPRLTKALTAVIHCKMTAKLGFQSSS